MKKKPTAMQYILGRAKYYIDHPEDNPLDVFHYIPKAEEVEDEPIKEQIMKQQTQRELFDLLYTLEVKYKFDETRIGKRIGELINNLQRELL